MPLSFSGGLQLSFAATATTSPANFMTPRSPCEQGKAPYTSSPTPDLLHDRVATSLCSSLNAQHLPEARALHQEKIWRRMFIWSVALPSLAQVAMPDKTTFTNSILYVRKLQVEAKPSMFPTPAPNRHLKIANDIQCSGAVQGGSRDYARSVRPASATEVKRSSTWQCSSSPCCQGATPLLSHGGQIAQLMFSG
eukprot:6073871-Amphidinium_carterae.1